MIEDDYTDADRWELDQNDPSQYCKHGTFIGNWAGPDILCHYCEGGYTDEEFAEEIAYQKRQVRESWVSREAVSLFFEFSKEIVAIDKTFHPPQAYYDALVEEAKDMKRKEYDHAVQ